MLKAESSGGGYQGHCLRLWGDGEGARIQDLCSRRDSTVGGGGQAELTPKHPPGPPRPPDSDLPPADASDLQGRQLLAGLDKVASDLDRQEKAITAILRPPLEQGRAVQDSAERAKDLKVPRAGGTGWPLGFPGALPTVSCLWGLWVLHGVHLPRVTGSPESQGEALF